MQQQQQQTRGLMRTIGYNMLVPTNLYRNWMRNLMMSLRARNVYKMQFRFWFDPVYLSILNKVFPFLHVSPYSILSPLQAGPL